MDYKLINNISNDVDQGLQQLYAEKSELVGRNAETSERIETLEAMIEAEEAKRQCLMRHLPDNVQTPSVGMPVGPSYRA